MKILYIGSVIFSFKILEKLFSINANIVGVITKSKSNFNSDFSDLSEIANKNSVPVHISNDVNSEITLDWIQSINPDIIFCFGWSNLLKKSILNISPNGVLGYHPSLLPFNKGRHPLIWAKVLGLKKTGSTFFFMDEGADSGDIVSQKEISIDFEDDAKTLYRKMIDVSKNQIESICKKLDNNSLKRFPQKKTGNLWRKRNLQDGLIDFRLNSDSICNLVRGLAKPYVGAHLKFNNKFIKIWKIKKSNESILIDYEPGKILEIIDKKIRVKTNNGSVWLIDHEFHEMPQNGSYLL
jgi:methionyl-tRNA formyltransferase